MKDAYIHQNFFNYLIPNTGELIILYIAKENEKMNLLLIRFNITESNKLYNSFKDISKNNYLRNDICEVPIYLQSIFINSFIKYKNKDKIIINNNKNKKYYKYEKNIGTFVSCFDENEIIKYQSKKIQLPQCLNILDEINDNNIHSLKFNQTHTEVIFDIYNDPNLLSLRNVAINFIITYSFDFLFLMQVKTDGDTDFANIKYDYDYKNITHIKFIRKYNLALKEPIILKYRIKQSLIITETIGSQLLSDICELSFESDNGELCKIDFCGICKNTEICQICNNILNSYLINDEKKNSNTFGKCICDEKKGFKKIPNKDKNMCVCKDNYSFYKNTKQCKSNEEINKMPTYKNDTEEMTLIDIYGDCYITCSKCSKGGFSYEEQNCDECREGFTLVGNNCISDYSIKLIEDNICLSDSKIWFQLGKYIFYFIKIDKCIFIYDENDLFFISNKEECLNLQNNPDYNYSYLSICLNNSKITNKDNYINFINNAKEYIPNEKNISIDKYIEEENIYFHLYNSEINYNNLSIMYLKENEKIDLLIFKVDIKRTDTISTQVEYQFYSPIPELIYINIDINGYLSTKNKKRKSENNNNESEYSNIYLDLPISWPLEKLDKIKELNKSGINAFNTSSEFYLDVCNEYTMPNKRDIYLQERKKNYYPDYPFCEENCSFIKYNLETDKIVCECKPKTTTFNFDTISFNYSIFKKKN